VIALGAPAVGERWIDGTFGRGGHTRAILAAGAEVLALDQDAAAVEAGVELSRDWPGQLHVRRGNFEEMESLSREIGWDEVAGVLLDLGVSSPQLDEAERGFSFQREGPLDMRMDQRQAVDAARIVNEATEDELSWIFTEYGNEQRSRAVARALVARRTRAPFCTTLDLAEVVAKSVGPRRVRGIHPATKVFQALRIAVNREPEVLMNVLPAATRLLQPGGRLAVIGFHSGEDRAVKNFMRDHAQKWLDTPRFPQSVPNPEHWFESVERALPTDEEMESNPRARSARLRVAWKRRTEDAS
jgi:16S rRNA (cytosine1402-N4)-methyltransferase